MTEHTLEFQLPDGSWTIVGTVEGEFTIEDLRLAEHVLKATGVRLGYVEARISEGFDLEKLFTRMSTGSNRISKAVLIGGIPESLFRQTEQPKHGPRNRWGGLK